MENIIICRTFLIFFLVQQSYSFTRKLNVTSLTDPNDSFCHKRRPVLFHIRAEGPNDALNYLWNFIDNPSVLVALTYPSSELVIEWNEVKPILNEIDVDHQCSPKKISFVVDPIFTYGMSINKIQKQVEPSTKKNMKSGEILFGRWFQCNRKFAFIYEFNDVNNTGNINLCNSENINALNPRYFKWYIKNETINDQLVEFKIVGHSYFDPDTNIVRNGSIILSVSVFGTLDNYVHKPSMLHSENSTQIDLSIDHLEANKTFSNSRFAVEIILVSDGDPKTSIPIKAKNILNDEYTPGVFKIMEIITPPLSNFEYPDNTSMFLQWKPITYTTKAREFTDSIGVIHYPLRRSENISFDTSNTILYPYYKNEQDRIIVRKLNVSFGRNGEEFYGQNKYISWTFLLGYSHAPVEHITDMLIAIMSNIVGIPLLMIIFYSCFTYHRRISKNDDELSILSNDNH